MSVIEYEGKRGKTFRVKFRDAQGRQVKQTLGSEREGWTPKRAKAELRARQVAADKGWTQPQAQTFANFSERWFSEGEEKRGWRPSTAKQYRSIQARLDEAFGPMRLDSIRPRHVAWYIAEMSEPTPKQPKGYGAATIGRDVSVLIALFGSAIREELITANPATRAERPKVPRRNWHILPRSRFAWSSAASRTSRRGSASSCSSRPGSGGGEMERLRWSDVDLIEHKLRVRQSKSEQGIRSIALAPRLAEELWEHRRRSHYQGDDERVFAHPELGTTYRGDLFRAAFDAALKAAGIEAHVRIHDLRHSSLTNGAAAGESPIALMSRAGHSSMKITQTYLHLAGTVFVNEAAALERRLLGGQSGTNLSESESTLEDASQGGSALQPEPRHSPEGYVLVDGRRLRNSLRRRSRGADAWAP